MRHKTERYDPYDPSIPVSEIWEQYEHMRNQATVFHVSEYGGFDVLTGYNQVREVAADPRTFSSSDGWSILPSFPDPIPPLDFDDPEHRRWVKLMQAPLTLGAVRGFEPMIEKIVNDQIDLFAAQESVDLYEHFAEPIPAHVICRIVGLSEEAANEMRRVGINVYAAIGTDQFDLRMKQFSDFTTRQLQSRRENPAEDYLSHLAAGEFNEESVDDAEVAGILVAFFVGGHHTTAAAIAALIKHVLSIPGLRQRVTSEPQIVGHVIEESLRLSAPLHHMMRTATKDITVAGCPVHAGARVMLNYAAANHDPQEFKEPYTFRLNRTRNRHLAFGHGIHLCIGRYLARAELRVALEQLLRRLPDLELAGDAVEPGYVGGNLVSLASLPVRFTPVA